MYGGQQQSRLYYCTTKLHDEVWMMSRAPTGLRSQRKMAYKMLLSWAILYFDKVGVISVHYQVK